VLYEKVILGAGISGILTSYFNPEAVLIDKQPFGQLSPKFDLGPRHVHYSKEIIKILKQEKIKYTIENIKIGYIKNNKSVKIKNIDLNEYFLKSRGEELSTKQSVLNSSKERFKAIVFNQKSFFKKILKNKKIIQNNIKEIKIKNNLFIITLDNKEKIETKEIISCIPFDILLKCLGVEKEIIKKFKKKEILFLTVNKSPINFKDKNFFYIIDNSYKFHRITKTSQKKYCMEFLLENNSFLDIIKENLFFNIKNIIILNSQIVETQETKRIIKNFKEKYPIKLIGRYAEWDRDLKINNIIEKIIKERIK